MRRLLIAVALVLGLLVVADRVTAVVAANAVAAQLQSAGNLRHQPMVSIRGFPFLTQAIAGRYDEVQLEARGLRSNDLQLDALQVTVRGARVPLRAALSGTVDAVPVDGLTATGVVGYDDLARLSNLPSAQVRPAGAQLDVTARVTVLGQVLTVASRSAVTVSGGSLVLTPQTVRVQGSSSDLLDHAVRDRFDLRLPIGTLPFGLHLTGARVTHAGLVVTARSGPAVLRRL